MRLKNWIQTKYLIIGGVISLAIALGGCVTDGVNPKELICEKADGSKGVFKFVYLSHKDTPGTIRQVTANNGAWVSICGKPGKPPKGL